MKFRGVLSGQFYYQIHHGGQGAKHSITAHPVNEQGEPDLATRVAKLTWGEPQEDADHLYNYGEGEISSVDVYEPKDRRKGIATKMLTIARGLSHVTQPYAPVSSRGMNLPEDYTFLSPEHSPERTQSGDKWARAVGGKIPDWEKCDHCADTTKGLYEHPDGTIRCADCM